MINRKIRELLLRPYVAILIGLNIGLFTLVMVVIIPPPNTIPVYTNNPVNNIALNSGSNGQSDLPSWGDKTKHISIRNPASGETVAIPEPNVDNLLVFSTTKPSAEDRDQMARYLQFCNGLIRVTWITQGSSTTVPRLVAAHEIAHSTMFEVEVPQQKITEVFGIRDISCKRTVIVDSSRMVILGDYLAISEIEICQILSSLVKL